MKSPGIDLHSALSELPESVSSIKMLFWGVDSFVFICCVAGLMLSAVSFYRQNYAMGLLIFFLSGVVGIAPHVADLFYY